MFGQILSEINKLVSTILMALMLRVVTSLAHYCKKHFMQSTAKPPNPPGGCTYTVRTHTVDSSTNYLYLIFN